MKAAAEERKGSQEDAYVPADDFDVVDDMYFALIAQSGEWIQAPSNN